jgi:hypothetical protein
MKTNGGKRVDPSVALSQALPLGLRNRCNFLQLDSRGFLR